MALFRISLPASTLGGTFPLMLMVTDAGEAGIIIVNSHPIRRRIADGHGQNASLAFRAETARATAPCTQDSGGQDENDGGIQANCHGGDSTDAAQHISAACGTIGRCARRTTRSLPHYFARPNAYNAVRVRT